MKKLSILIPVFDVGNYIGSLLDCILKQMDDSMEIVLLNDGSHDCSDEICAKYQGKYPERIKYISRENKGAVRTRRELVQTATGEWIWIIDSDDMIVDNSLKIIMKAILDDESCDMIWFDYYLDSIENSTVVHQLPYKNGSIFEGKQKDVIYKELISGSKLNMLWDKAFKRNCFDFDVDYSEYEDVKKANDRLQLMPIISNAKKIKYINTPLYIYNTGNQDSLSHRIFKEYTYTSLKKVRKVTKEYICKWGLWEELQDEFYLRGAKVAISILRRYAWSDKTMQEYFLFFDILMEDGVFSEAIEKCDCSKMKWKHKIFVKIMKHKKRILSYIIFVMLKRIL